ncbi:MAG: glycosyltransferase family 2 protein [Blastocatellia bacterium]|nr:glycosyltransferase family 2 protein [Blastocatellia bacterium]
MNLPSSPSLSPPVVQVSGVSIVIPSYNGRHLLERFLPSVVASAVAYERQTQAPTEIIVVDDGSRDGTVDWLKTAYPERVQCLVQPANRGFSPACNLGFRAARFPIVWLLNNDIETSPNALLPLVPHFSEKEVFAVGCRAYRLGPTGERTTEIDGAGRVAEMVRGFWKVYRSYDLLPSYDRTAHGPLYTMMASGGYAAFSTEKLRTLGGFEELLAPFYWEDAELCYRAWKRGWTVRFEPESLVYHQASATIAHQFEPKAVSVVATRNRILMHWIHLHDTWWWMAHLFMLGLLLTGDAVQLKFHYWQALGQAWQRRRAARQRRWEEAAAALRSDREVIRIINEVTCRPGVATYKNAREYKEFQQKCHHLQKS